MSWEKLQKLLQMENQSQFDFTVDDEIRTTGATGGRERVQKLRVWIEAMIAETRGLEGFIEELELWHAELCKIIDELEGFEDRESASQFQDAFGAIADALVPLIDAVEGGAESTALLGPLANLESAVTDFDRQLAAQLAAEEGN
ncbi:MAG: hypothetical protein KF760_07690 [Candidatus Eremiobacteraeota bacterium]|nr:hypothetical protein [Candidatus Eremiobacteraeota bacterium]MCW5872778.1 hypothetical protein [Candidatus Eremiobacteraeota bacterium]